MHAPTAAGYSLREPTQAPPWHGLVVWDVLFNALATGLFLTASLDELLNRTRVAIAYPVALALLLVDLTLLVVDLGSPSRFHHMLRVFKPSSPMSLGTWCLTAFSLPLTALVVCDLFGGPDVLRIVFIILALPFAFGSMVYKGVLFSTSSQPGWRDARWFGAYHAASALALGCGVLFVLSLVSGRQAGLESLRLALGLLVAGQCVPLILLAAELRAALRKHYRPAVVRLLLAIAAVGVLFPLMTLLAPIQTALDGLAVGVMLTTAWVPRAAFIYLPHASRAAETKTDRAP